MAAEKSAIGRAFYEAYKGAFPDLEQAAEQLQKVASDALSPRNLDLHLVAARAKEPDSVLKKIRAKEYIDPSKQLTDQIGLRVITYYEDDVDRVVAILRDILEVDEANSEDKRVALGLREFGYRSVHLVAQLRGASEWSPLRDKWFEVQVRSLLEHAWAEVEHEVVYKAGIQYPLEVRRRFHALAGAVEILDQQFLLLRGEREKLIESYRDTYERGEELGEKLDAARLLGLLEWLRPGGLSWRDAARVGAPFPPRVESTCVEALASVGISSAGAMRDLFREKKFVRVVRDFASSAGIAEDEVSHLAIAVLSVAYKDSVALTDRFPEMQPLVASYVPSVAPSSLS
jgi:ppGpp synthetase/RelA/SpoT-type nucleotidyltranferase